ncbi:NAD binding 10 multi-domain protein [Pyrenophora tritici-repentis]|nr:NAD binding 10 multi-domain protein [Pyrenophora tritici-repentis]
MSTPLTNIVILGASGSVGRPILSALLTLPSINLTIVTRTSSTATFPTAPNIRIHTLSDALTLTELTAAFKNHHAVIVALSTTPVTSGTGPNSLAFRLIDAARAAGVQRFIPSEFGANNLDPRARALVPVYDIKGAMLEYLQQTCAAINGAMSWTSISCGSWLDWALDPAKSGNFLGIDVKARRATVWDSGENRFAVTTSENTGLAVARVLAEPDIARDRQVFLCDFSTCTNEILGALEKEMGEQFVVERKESGPLIKELKKRYDGGDSGAAFPILAMSFGADVDVGYDFPKEQEVWNEKLGLPKVGLEDVVREAVELAARS